MITARDHCTLKFQINGNSQTTAPQLQPWRIRSTDNSNVNFPETVGLVKISVRELVAEIFEQLKILLTKPLIMNNKK